jgi:hypothetical protein
MSETKVPSMSVMSKKRYNEIEQTLQQLIKDPCDHALAMNKICEIMKFDPKVGVYTPEKGKQMSERRRQKAAALGISQHAVNMGKKYYEYIKSLQCTNYLCESRGYDQYNGFCIRCFVHMFPGNEVVKRYKTKEATVVEYIKNAFPAQAMVLDKAIEGGCSRYRPDIFMDCLTHSIIVEIDENQHDTYDCTCENKRMMTLFNDLGSRPLVMIRFNPDDYTNTQGNKIKSCFTYKNKVGLPKIENEKLWNNRLGVLRNRIDAHISTVPEQELTIEHLYYDGFE